MKDLGSYLMKEGEIWNQKRKLMHDMVQTIETREELFKPQLTKHTGRHRKGVKSNMNVHQTMKMNRQR